MGKLKIQAFIRDVKEVKNLLESSELDPCPNGPWITHWERYSGQAATICSNHACKNATEDLAGAHVVIVGSDQPIYIVPLCSECNHPTNTESMKVFGSLLMSASEHDLCN